MKTLLLNPQVNHQLSPEEDTLYLLLLDQTTRRGATKVSLSFRTAGVTCRLVFIGRLSAQSHWRLESDIRHLVEHTSCQTDVYLSQADNSRVDYLGRIYIAQAAAYTRSFLKEQSLTLGRATFNRSQPILEIFSNKVRASHSASSSRFDEDNLFYLMSRGFDRQISEKILEEAFFNGIINTIESIRAKRMIKDYLC